MRRKRGGKRRTGGHLPAVVICGRSEPLATSPHEGGSGTGGSNRQEITAAYSHPHKSMKRPSNTRGNILKLLLHVRCAQHGKTITDQFKIAGGFLSGQACFVWVLVETSRVN